MNHDNDKENYAEFYADLFAKQCEMVLYQAGKSGISPDTFAEAFTILANRWKSGDA